MSSQTALFGDLTAPHQGRTDATRAASASGARAAVHDRAFKIDRVRRAWRQPHTMQEIAQLTGYELTSICSLKDCLRHELCEVDTQTRRWPSGRTTARTVFQLTAFAPKGTPAAQDGPTGHEATA